MEKLTLSFTLILLFLINSNPIAQPYQKLHHNAIVIDTHNDVLSTATMKGVAFDANLKG